MSSVFADSIEVRSNQFNGYHHKLSIIVHGQAKKIKMSGGTADPLVIAAKPGESLDGKELSFETPAAENGIRRSTSTITVDVQGSHRSSAKVGDRVKPSTLLALE